MIKYLDSNYNFAALSYFIYECKLLISTNCIAISNTFDAHQEMGVWFYNRLINLYSQKGLHKERLKSKCCYRLSNQCRCIFLNFLNSDRRMGRKSFPLLWERSSLYEFL
jgi:hypothetical protein